MPRSRSPVVAPSKPRLWKVLGAGLITGASDDDPSGIATYSQAGAQFGYGLGWTLLLTYPLMVAIQSIAARIGRTTGLGLAGNLREHYPRPLLHGIVGLLFLANALNIGADLSAMGAAMHLIVPSLAAHWFVIVFGLGCVLIQVFMQYQNYVSVLKWLTISLFAYVATMFAAHADWHAVMLGFVRPQFSRDPEFWKTVIAIFGTTISPYLFFWQASQEVEDTKAAPEREPLRAAPAQGEVALWRIQLDTLCGMGLSNAVALAIVITAAATLHAHGIQHIDSAAQAAEALRPIAGSFTFALFALGIVGTGLLSVPVLAGSAAYAVGEARGWKVGLARPPTQARAFYGAIAVATLLGTAVNIFAINPMDALIWCAVINAIVSVPVMTLIMLMAGSHSLMGRFRVGPGLKALGWTATAAMAAAAIAFGLTSLS